MAIPRDKDVIASITEAILKTLLLPLTCYVPEPTTVSPPVKKNALPQEGYVLRAWFTP